MQMWESRKDDFLRERDHSKKNQTLLDSSFLDYFNCVADQ